MKRLVCMLLVLSVLFSVSFNAAAAAEETGKKKTLTVWVEKDQSTVQETIPVLIKNGKAYVEPQFLSKLTRYYYRLYNKQFIFQLGLKNVVVSIPDNTLEINQVSQPFSGIVEENGTYYLPAAEMLAWMNVACIQEDRQLTVTSDICSYWEAVSYLNVQDYEYNLAEQLGSTPAGKLLLLEGSFVNGLLNFGDDTLKKVGRYKNTEISVYEYEIYKKCFRDFALPEKGEQGDIYTGISEISKNYSRRLKGAESTVPVLFNDFIFDKFIREPESDYNGEAFLEDTETELKDLKTVEKVLKILKEANLYAALALKDTEDYADALQYIYLREGVTVKDGIDDAAEDAIEMLRSKSGAIKEGTVDILQSQIEKAAMSMAKDGLEAALEDTVSGALFGALDIVDGLLTAFYPINESFEEMDELEVYHRIQGDALNAYYSFPQYGSELTGKDIQNARMCMILFLKTAKKCYKVQDSLLSKGGGKGINDWKIDMIDERLAKLNLAGLAGSHDAICNKEEETRRIEEILNKQIALENNQGDLPSWLQNCPGRYLLEDDPRSFLEISKITGNGDVHFSAVWHRTATIESAAAKWDRDRNWAYFDLEHQGQIKSGYLEITDENTVSVTLTECSYPIDPGTYVFKASGNSDSWETDMIYDQDLGCGWIRGDPLKPGDPYGENVVLLRFGTESLEYRKPAADDSWTTANFFRAARSVAIDGFTYDFESLVGSGASIAFELKARGADPGKLSGRYEVNSMGEDVPPREKIDQSAYLKNCRFYPTHCMVEVTRPSILMSQPGPAWTVEESTENRLTSTELTKVEVGAQFVATGLYCNSTDDLWYRVLTDVGSDAYLPCDRVEFRQGQSDLQSDQNTILAMTGPTELTCGSVFPITGTIQTQYDFLDSVSAEVFRVSENGEWDDAHPLTGGTEKVNGYRYQLDRSSIDRETEFNILEPGEYLYVVSCNVVHYYAEDQDFKNMKDPETVRMIVFTQEFKVI